MIVKTETLPIETYEAKNLSEYIKYISKIKSQEENAGNKSDLLFRGQPKDFDLVPKLCRLQSNGIIQDIEKIIINDFKNTSIPYLINIPRDNWEWIAVAQHYGLPTRYLDWTYSCLSALWFAVEEQKYPLNYKEYSVVYLFKPLLEDFKRVEEYPNPFEIDYTVIYRPPQIDKRIIAQQGLFTAHMLKENGLTVKMNKHKNYKRKLIKIKIHGEYRFSIRKELSISGINSITQYPDLIGVCKHLTTRYFKNIDERTV